MGIKTNQAQEGLFLLKQGKEHQGSFTLPMKMLRNTVLLGDVEVALVLPEDWGGSRTPTLVAKG